MDENLELNIPDRLKSKEDGRKKAWWIKKIEALEAEVAKYKESGCVINEVYANGFIDCMNKFQIMNKAARNNLRHQIEVNGPGAVKRLKSAKFRGITL